MNSRGTARLLEARIAETPDEARDGGLGGARQLGQLGVRVGGNLAGKIQYKVHDLALAARQLGVLDLNAGREGARLGASRFTGYTVPGRTHDSMASPALWQRQVNGAGRETHISMFVDTQKS